MMCILVPYKNPKRVIIISGHNLEIPANVTNSSFCFDLFGSAILNSSLLEGFSWKFSQLTPFSKLNQNQNKNETNPESWKTWIFYLIVLKVCESPIMWIMVPNWRGEIGLSLVNSFCYILRSEVTLRISEVIFKHLS